MTTYEVVFTDYRGTEVDRKPDIKFAPMKRCACNNMPGAPKESERLWHYVRPSGQEGWFCSLCGGVK